MMLKFCLRSLLLHVFLSLTLADTSYSCQPPNISNYGLTWLSEPQINPYVHFTAPIVQRSWYNAGTFCNSLGSQTDKINLARIMNKYENQAVLGTLKTFNPNARKSWIAGNGVKGTNLRGYFSSILGPVCRPMTQKSSKNGLFN